jgi:L-seryl-tRNA(Ser) seleniumtransferase
LYLYRRKKRMAMVSDANVSLLSSLPGVESLLKQGDTACLVAEFGRQAVTLVIRAVLAQVRAELLANSSTAVPDDLFLIRIAARQLQADAPSLRRVFNLTGTVLHTNPGRAALREDAIGGLISEDAERGL